MSDKEKELWQNIQGKPYCDPKKRMDFILFFDVRDGNPNGDPDAGNLPRMDPETRHGIVTDVCIKRKIRDYLATLKDEQSKPLCSIYIQSQAALNSLYFDAARAIKNDKPESDSLATEEEKRRRKEDKDAVDALLVELDENEDNDFEKLIAVPEEEPAESNKPDSGNIQEVKPHFREWLASIFPQVDGLEFHDDCGVVSYLGEANTKQKFQDLFKQAEVDYDGYKQEFNTLAGLMAKAKGKGSAQERKARDAVKRKMCELYDDIRLFGGVLTAGTNAGQIRGPMQLTFARSVEPILQMDAAITRCAITTASDFTKKQTEFGRKPWLNWAVYRQHGFYNPLLGQQTGVTSSDLARFWEALAWMFRNSDSASKGEMTMYDIIVFVHDHPRGNAPSHLLFDKIKCEIKCDKNNSNNQENKDITIIKREGFEKYYMINIGTQSNGKIKVARPLRDLWE